MKDVWFYYDSAKYYYYILHFYYISWKTHVTMVNKPCETAFSVDLFVYSCLHIARLIGSYPECTNSVLVLFRDRSNYAR